MSVARHHAEWLSLVEVSGPFLSLPVLLDVFPDGLEKREDLSDVRARLNLAHEEWLDNQGGLEPDPAIHAAWVAYVLQDLLEYESHLVLEGQELPPSVAVPVPEHSETLRPDFALADPDASGKPRILVTLLPKDHSPESSPAGARWKAPATTRMMTLLHGAGIRLGVVTNGEEWVLVHAKPGETTTFASFYANLFLEEPLMLRAFMSLLTSYRLFAVPADETLEALFERSAEDQQEVTDQLGYQVRRAVEVLIQSIDRIDRDRNRELLKHFDEKRLYEAAVTVMMRLVFLLAAEERDLLLLGDPIYDQHYAVSTLRDQLQEIADKHGEEVLRRRYDAWSRLLATFRVVYAGVRHETMRLPAYGGSLFDPDRFTFLEGRQPDTSFKTHQALPLPIDNLTVLDLLNAIQLLEVKVPGGGPAEARRLSFRALDVEQIGHVYEGLLDHTAVRAKGPVVSLRGTKDKEPEIELQELEQLKSKGDDALLTFLTKATGRQKGTLKKALAATIPDEDLRRWQLACDNNPELLQRVRPWAGFVREDAHGQPVVFDAGAVYVTEGVERRATGTHYTPRSLTEPVVQYTLEPLVYEGPAQGKAKEDWKLKPAKRLLALKVCDMAMGSGAFLVQACRYLSERVVEAWDDAEAQADGQLVITPDGDLAQGSPSERPLPKDPDERLAVARRLVVDRCLYGVDKNPMAVEMAKLSLWLTTLQKGKPFTFVDHALRCGDSLLGLTDVDQIRYFHVDPEVGRKSHSALLDWGYLKIVRGALDRATQVRRRLEAISEDSARDVEHKTTLLADAEAAVGDARLVADLIVGAVLATAAKGEKALSETLEMLGPRLAGVLKENDRGGRESLRDTVDQLFRHERPGDRSTRRAFHWCLEYPEVVGSGGFDAFIGNPPFLKGQAISGQLGQSYREWLAQHVAAENLGLSDIVACFIVRASRLTAPTACIGVIATNTISEGDTKKVGLDGPLASGCAIYRAVADVPWPGNAAVIVSTVFLRRGYWDSGCVLNGEVVDAIGSALGRGGQEKIYALAENEGLAFNGVYVNGEGFYLSDDEAQQLLDEDPSYEAVIRPYINGVELFSCPGARPTRSVLSFWDWSEERSSQYSSALERVRERVKPYRDTVKRKRTRELWWLFAENRPGMCHAIGLGERFRKHPKGWANASAPQRIICKTKTSQTWAFVFLPSDTLCDQTVIVVADDDYATFGNLQSSVHWYWAVQEASRHKTDMRYSPKLFLTFPRARRCDDVRGCGRNLYEQREAISLSRRVGLTDLFHLVNDHNVHDEDIDGLRTRLRALDRAVVRAYDWHDELRHGFYETRYGWRYTIDPAQAGGLMGRLALLNANRHRQEEASKTGSARAPSESQDSAVNSAGLAPSSSVVPSQQTLGFVRTDGATKHHSDAASSAVVEVLRQATEPLGKSEILERAGISPDDWTRTIRDLKRAGLVEQIGSKRSSRYTATTRNEANR